MFESWVFHLNKMELKMLVSLYENGTGQRILVEAEGIFKDDKVLQKLIYDIGNLYIILVGIRDFQYKYSSL